MSIAPTPVKTPCNKLCIVEGESGLCMGCYRKRSEVAAWGLFSDDEREAIMVTLPARRTLIRPEKLAMF